MCRTRGRCVKRRGTGRPVGKSGERRGRVSRRKGVRWGVLGGKNPPPQFRVALVEQLGVLLGDGLPRGVLQQAGEEAVNVRETGVGDEALQGIGGEQLRKGRHWSTKGESLEAFSQLLLLLLQALNGGHEGPEKLLGPSGGFRHREEERW